MHKYWTFRAAGSIHFGNRSIEQLPKLIQKFKATKISIITDPGIVQAGILDKITHVLAQAQITSFIYDRAMPEPSMASVLNCYSQLELYDPELIIAVGGGSCIDLAKIGSLLLAHGGHPSDYFGENKVPGEIRPIIAIPTTAGTGSEITPIAVVTDDKTNLKVGISDHHLRPAVALLDPALTTMLPPYITACTGMDALSQAIEAYFAKDFQYTEGENLIYQGSNPLSDVLAEKAIRLISENIRMAVHQGANLEARSNMLLGNLFSALAVSNSGTSLSHALAYPIGEKTKRPHGEIIGLLLPYIIKYNAQVCTNKFATIAELIGESSPELTQYQKAVRTEKAIFRLLHDLGMPSRLSQIGIGSDDIPEIVESSLSIDRLIRINPRQPRTKDVESLLYEAL